MAENPLKQQRNETKLAIKEKASEFAVKKRKNK